VKLDVRGEVAGSGGRNGLKGSAGERRRWMRRDGGGTGLDELGLRVEVLKEVVRQC